MNSYFRTCILFGIFFTSTQVLASGFDYLKLLKDLVSQNLNAHSLEEWQSSEKTPQNIFKNMLPSLVFDENEQTLLCEAFQKLNSQDLGLFTEELEKTNLLSPSCRKKLVQKIDEYFLKTKIHLLEEQNLDSFVSLETEKQIDQETVYLQNSADIFYDGKLPEKHIALTFDDGPHRQHTPEVLKILKDYGVKAGFFEVGSAMRESPDLVLQTHQEGHVLGTHSWSHPMLSKMPLAQAQREIQTAIEEQFFIVKETSFFFRFPYGSFNKPLQNWVQSQKYTSFFWNMDSRDWQIRNPLDLFNTVVHEINREKKGILLFHDTHPQTVQVLPLVLDYLKNNHYILTVFRSNLKTKN